jgi:hypothetical protein
VVQGCVVGVGQDLEQWWGSWSLMRWERVSGGVVVVSVSISVVHHCYDPHLIHPLLSRYLMKLLQIDCHLVRLQGI